MALSDTPAVVCCEIEYVDIEVGFAAVVGGEGNPRAVGGPCAEIVDHAGCVCQGRVGAGGWIEQPELLTFVAAAIDAVDQAVVGGGAAEERDLFVVVDQLLAGAVGFHAPELRGTGAAQMEQGLSVT